MNGTTSDQAPEGVYGPDPEGRDALVHAYTGEDYGLDDVHFFFGFGRLDSAADEVVLTLSGDEIHELKIMADAQSFDHPEDFIAMCLDIHNFATGRGAGPFRFRANF